MSSKLMRAASALLVVGLGIGVAGVLIANRPIAAHVEAEVPLTLVEVQTVTPGNHRVHVPAMGIVQPEREVGLQAEVGGIVTQVGDRLVDGGVVTGGELLLKIDARDYATQLQINQAELAQARLAVREETQQRRVAQAEWREVPEGFAPESREYVMREPHMEAAEARVESVQSRIKKAKRDLGKASVRAPFDAVVLNEDVDVGQLVGPGVPVARLAGVSRFWVVASAPVSQLQFLEIPGVNTLEPRGSAAEVSGPADGDATSREAYVLRLLPAVEQRGRMAQVVVAVEDPLGLRLPPHERPTPLLVGTYVELELRGKVLEDVVPVPRSALRDDRFVWTVGEEGRLHAREVDIAWRERERVLVSAGLKAGDRVVTTNLPVATEGMKVEIAPSEAPASSAADPLSATVAEAVSESAG
jgi:RND family efflux transporter MFP subunit